MMEPLTGKQANRQQALMKPIHAHLETLDDEQRVAFIAECMEDYCELCGSGFLPCYCAPCYDI